MKDTSPRPLPSQEVLLDLLDYDRETGLLTWRERSPSYFAKAQYSKSWNTKHAGTPALTTPINSFGHLHGCLLGQYCLAHRVIWKLVHGEEPPEIEHDDGNGGNNRLTNLTAGTRQSNSKNVAMSSRNSSGMVGVSWNRSRQEWRAYIRHSGKHVALGSFSNFDAAVSARKAGEAKYGYHRNHGRPLGQHQRTA